MSHIIDLISKILSRPNFDPIDVVAFSAICAFEPLKFHVVTSIHWSLPSRLTHPESDYYTHRATNVSAV